MLDRFGFIATCISMIGLGSMVSAQSNSQTTEIEFFESRVRPVLVEHCYSCHNSSDVAEGGLAVDWREPIRQPTEHGTAVVPGKPSESLILKVLRHEISGLKMPDGGPKLESQTVADIEEWIRRGAIDPRDQAPTSAEIEQATAWETTLARRKQWWSFQPIQVPKVPPGATHPVDAFIRARLAKKDLQPAQRADRMTRLRRLTFVITGLPPTPQQIAEFSRVDASDGAFERFVDQLLSSSAFGERWARHFMDLVRYADSHGSEGDPSIPNAYQYRDYLIRALNDDVPYNQLILEHIAGDLLDRPRINPTMAINESVIGPAHWRMVFHGFAPTDALDEKVRFVDDQINVFSKAFLGLTVSCARCHDHKFDPISQKDYYALFGILGSCRPALRDANSYERQRMHVDQLGRIKDDLRQTIASSWLRSIDQIAARLATPNDNWKARIQSATAPDQLLDLWRRIYKQTDRGDKFQDVWQEISEEWHQSEAAAVADRNHENAWYWNMADSQACDEWFPQGNGLTGQPCEAGDFVVAVEGDRVISNIYPAGVRTNSISAKHRGFLASRKIHLDDRYRIWFHVAGQNLATMRYSVQHYPRDGTVYPIKNLDDGDWSMQSLDLAYWQGDDVHFELATARDAPIVTRDKDRSWFGLREVIVRRHGDPEPVRNQREYLSPFFAAASSATPATRTELANVFAQTLRQTITDWRDRTMSDSQALLLNTTLAAGLLPNDVKQLEQVAALLDEYRQLEEDLPQPTRVPGLAESEGMDHPLFERGNHKKPTDPVRRRFLEAIDSTPYRSHDSGRLELAASVIDPSNPLTSRVMVNRVWHYVFGRGIVATPDNFGKLGSQPSHPELLDYLAQRFVADRWSIKRLIRLMVTSETWQAQSKPSVSAATLDPANELLSHANVRRLDAESIHDALLEVAGELDRTMYGRSERANRDSTRRGIYIATHRNSLDHFLQVFDAPVPFATKGRRDATNVPAQSLTMLNDPWVRKLARQWAIRILASHQGIGSRALVSQMFQRALGRSPSDQETVMLVQYVRQLEQSAADRVDVGSQLAHALFNLKEFIYLK